MFRGDVSGTLCWFIGSMKKKKKKNQSPCVMCQSGQGADCYQQSNHFKNASQQCGPNEVSLFCDKSLAAHLIPVQVEPSKTCSSQCWTTAESTGYSYMYIFTGFQTKLRVILDHCAKPCCRGHRARTQTPALFLPTMTPCQSAMQHPGPPS